jgi:phosphoribosyl-AMP cyclohydrolase
LEASLTKNLKFDDKGLIPAIVQDADSSDVLMLGYMNRESIERTLSSGEVWFYSRSRQELWHKGATSGNRLIVQEVQLDCDGDAILVKAKPLGPTCHTGEKSCFFQRLSGEDAV